ncbi:MAG TPA: hypothetical protein VM599_10805 [Thermoanaerobaculia bacterium]|nr:hypothetical protein [Thermoanaerobaculia bacterium]
MPLAPAAPVAAAAVVEASLRYYGQGEGLEESLRVAAAAGAG